MKVLALDFEGSHKNPRVGCPVQLGVAVMEGEQVMASAEWLIRPPLHWKTGKPTREVDAYALRISGLDLERIETEGLTSGEACRALQTWVSVEGAGSLPVLAFSMSYDIECYEQLLFDGGWFDFDLREYILYPAILGAKWICARQTARRMLPNMLRHSLDDVAAKFDLARISDTHGALEDAILAARCYHLLTESKAKVPA